LDPQHFVVRHAILLPFALMAMIAISTMSLKAVRRLALAMFVISLLLMVLTVTTGEEVKGASRWIYIFGFSIQPSEFVKPAFAVMTAWLLAPRSANEEIPGAAICTLIFTLIIALLMAQPDIGQAGVFTAVWLSQWFLAGLSIAWIGGSAVLGGLSLMAAYFVFPHVALRIDRFMDPSATSYQIERATQAFLAGGYTGEGPGEGIIKASIPDAHTDMVMAVAGEEYGLIMTLGIVAIFAFIVLRGFSRLFKEHNAFVTLAGFGLLVQFGLQAAINMASTLNLIPTKGMTLPFMSYGGSSLLAMSIGMGMLLALTRRRVGEEE
ncbi:MAG: cell division protein FtsW, partial [Alphaproteobacteria bacterium]|nr:cell division protein FtsW [Alphaproteobacteria bacterium]